MKRISQETRELIVGCICLITGVALLASVLHMNAEFAVEGPYDGVAVTAEENHALLYKIQQRVEVMVIQKMENEQ